MLRHVGVDAEAMASVQPQGLRFNVPAGRENTNDVGVESRLRLHGDFEITLDYEVLDWPNPSSKLGAGPVLQIVLDTPEESKARMDRLRRLKDDVFGANAIDDTFRGLAAPRANEKEKIGQLRMIRVGKTLYYHVREGSVPFYEIARYDIGSEDVVAVQVLCATGHEPVALSVVFPRLELRSTKIEGKAENVAVVENARVPPNPAPNTPRPAPKSGDPAPGGHTFLVMVIGLGLIVSLLAMVGVGIYLWRATRRGGATASKPAKAIAQPIRMPCPECGKKLAVKPALMGKKIKCPHCGKAVLAESATGEADGD
jgi:hypothetical protein